MTCIVALGGAVVTMAADSQATASENLYKEVRRDNKIFRAGPDEEYVIGFSSSYRGGQILRYHVDWPAFPVTNSDDDVLRFFVSKIVPKVRRALDDHWHNRGEDTLEFIVAVKNIFVVIPNDMQVALVHDFAAIGSGAMIAQGALEILTQGPDRVYPGGPERIVRAALKAAQKHTAGVGEPFVVMQTKFVP